MHNDSTTVVDVAEAYQALAGKLEQSVRFDVQASDVVIEDACQFAWARLIHHAGNVRREKALPWLSRTAVREALKLLRRERRELSLDAELEAGGGSLAAAGSLTAHEAAEQRERLAMLRDLPDRQQRMLWLHALGLSYGEIAGYLGCTPRTVERQLLRGKSALRRADAAGSQ